MDKWTYYCYIDAKPDIPWERWYLNNPGCQAEHDAKFSMLEQRNDWTGSPCRKIKGSNYKGIYEVRLTQSALQYRIFFCDKKGVNRAKLMLGFGYHKGSSYDPRDILDTVLKRKKAIENGTMASKICNRPKKP